MSQYILGSGVTGCLAAKILGPSWHIIPFKKSRYYTFEVPYADNFIVYDEHIDKFIQSELINKAMVIYKSPFSMQGQLMYQATDLTLEPYLHKVYGPEVPVLAKKLLKTTYTTYSLTVKQLHDKLQAELSEKINDGVRNFKDLYHIDLKNREMHTKNGVFKYDRIVSTIPLDALYKMCGLSAELRARNTCFYHIMTSKVDLEGASQAYVADPEFLFYKVYTLAKDSYLFCTLDVVDSPYQYFGAFLGYNLDLIEAKRIENVIPIGEPPDTSLLREHGIECVGSNAQWDDFVDTTTAIRKLLRLRS